MPDEIDDARVEAWKRDQYSPPPEPPVNPATPTCVEMVPMRDGVSLYTEVFLPDEGGPHPVVLVRSPYPYGKPSRHDKRPVSRYTNAGYAFVFQLTRGQGRSEGVFRYMRDDINDGYDSIEWLTKQPWCNGRVGMEGASYLGGTQLMAAKSGHPALHCIMPTAFVGNNVECYPYSYGVPNKGPYMQWMQVLDAERSDALDTAYGDMNAVNHPKWGPAFKKRPLIDAADAVITGDKLNHWRQAMSHPMDDGFWRAAHFTDEDLADLNLPIFLTDGFYDMSIGPIAFFQRLQKLNPDNPDIYLLAGPWDHSQTASRSIAGDYNGDRVMPPGGEIDHMDHRLRFFGRYLKGDTSIVVQESAVRVYVAGTDSATANRWVSLPSFPGPGAGVQELYLHSQGGAQSFPGDGVLDFTAPCDDEPVDRYVYDPALPTASQVETSKDRRATEIRSDVLTYTSAPLEAPLTILGDIELILYAASDGPDTDWFVVLTEVFPDGQSKSFHYAPPAFRARYREGSDKEVFLTPNQPELFRIPMGPASHQIAAGHRLRLSIFSAAFPEYDPNPNTGHEAATDTQSRIALQTICHDRERPSHIVLPVMEGAL